MKLSGSIFTVVAVVLFGVVNVLAATADDVVNAIEAVTTQSRDLQTVTSGLTVINFPLRGFQVARGLNNIQNTVGNFVSSLDPEMPPFDDADATPIVDALVTFVRVHQLLLSTIIGKHGLFEMFRATAPVAAALQGVEGTVDALAFALIGLIPTKGSQAEMQFAALNVTFTQAISAYRN
ncbi:hypothetical protein C8Q76DRAFT_857411 [Earliella scabrosa]|nr:hypothetical protein C8Q76DRAFT_857411 [Earliella scabrosa]